MARPSDSIKRGADVPKKMMRGPKPAHHKIGECNSDYSAP
jgi:hypothetical protein